MSPVWQVIRWSFNREVELAQGHEEAGGGVHFPVVETGFSPLQPKLSSGPGAGPDNHENPNFLAADRFWNHGLSESEAGIPPATGAV